MSVPILGRSAAGDTRSRGGTRSSGGGTGRSGGPEAPVRRGAQCLRPTCRGGSAFAPVGGRPPHIGIRPSGRSAHRSVGAPGTGPGFRFRPGRQCRRGPEFRLRPTERVQRAASAARLHSGARHSHGPADQGSPLAGPHAHDAADARDRASGTRERAEDRRFGPRGPPRARPDAAYRGAAPRGWRGCRGRRGGHVRGDALVRSRPVRADGHLHPAVHLAPAVAGRGSRDGEPYRTPPGYRLHPAGRRLPADRRHHHRGTRRGLAGGGLPAPRRDPP